MRPAGLYANARRRACVSAMWAFHGKPDSPRNARVLKVLEFNGEFLAESLPEAALIAILGTYDTVSSSQGTLFD